jgi:hypothetical protein
VPWRREVFLAHFAGTANETEAAELAGVTTSTVYRHRRKDPEFAALHQLALEQSYVRLEADALRQRILAQQRLAQARDEGFEASGEIAQEFERVMKLFARWDRRNGQPGPRTAARDDRTPWNPDEALRALERKLRALAIPIEAGPVGDDEDLGEGEIG